MENIEKELENELNNMLGEMIQVSLNNIIQIKDNNIKISDYEKNFFLEFLNEFKDYYSNDHKNSTLIQELIDYFK